MSQPRRLLMRPNTSTRREAHLPERRRAVRPEIQHHAHASPGRRASPSRRASSHGPGGGTHHGRQLLQRTRADGRNTGGQGNACALLLPGSHATRLQPRIRDAAGLTAPPSIRPVRAIPASEDEPMPIKDLLRPEQSGCAEALAQADREPHGHAPLPLGPGLLPPPVRRRRPAD